MFPDFELETLKMILQDNQYDLEKTMEDLFKMNDQKETSSSLPQPNNEENLNISNNIKNYNLETNKDQEETSAFDDNGICINNLFNNLIFFHKIFLILIIQSISS